MAGCRPQRSRVLKDVSKMSDQSESIDVKQERVGNGVLRLRVEVPADVVDAELRKAYRVLRRRAVVPGFRPGKAPLSALRRVYGKDVDEDVADELIRRSIRSAQAQVQERIVATGPVYPVGRVEPGSPLVYAADLYVVDVSGEPDPSAIEWAVPDFPAEEVRRSLMGRLRVLQWDSGDAAPWDGAAQLGDVVEGFIETTDEEGGATLDQVEIPMDPLVAEAKGIDSKLIEAAFGRHAGDDVALPDNGGSLPKRLYIGGVARVTLPRFDDELAKDHGHESLDELLDAVVAEVLPKVAEAVRKRIHAQILAAFAEQLEVEVHDKAREELEAHLPRTSGFPRKMLVELLIAQYREEAVRKYLVDHLEGAEVPAAQGAGESDADSEEARYAEAWAAWVDEHFGVSQAIEARMAEWKEAARALAREVVEELGRRPEDESEGSSEAGESAPEAGVSPDESEGVQPVSGAGDEAGLVESEQPVGERGGEPSAESDSALGQDDTPAASQPEEGSPGVVVDSAPAAAPAGVHEESNR